MAEFLDNAKEVAQAVGQDIGNKSTPEKVTAATLATGLIAHQLGNSAILGLTAANVYYATGNNPFWAALAAGVACLTMESALSAGAATHLSDFSHTTQALERIHAKRPAGHKGHNHSSKVSRAITLYNKAMLAVGLGAAGVVADEFARNPSADRKRLLRRGMRVSRRLAVYNGGVVLSITGGIKLAEKAGHQEAADAAVHLFRNPLFYLSVMSAGIAARAGHRAYYNHRAKRQHRQIPQQRIPKNIPEDLL